MTEDLLKLEKEEREALKNLNSHHDIMERINNIIQLKIRINNTSDKPIDLYLDLKHFIKAYILSTEEGKYGYDEINLTRILDYTNYLNDEECLSILKYLMRLLYLHGFDEEYKTVEKAHKKKEIRYLVKYKLLNNPFRLFFLLSTYNTTVILSIILLTVIIGWGILLPAPSWSTPLFETNLSRFSGNNLFNVLLNLVSEILHMNKDFKIIPLNTFGSLILIFSKLFIILFVVNILIKELNNKLNI